MSRESLTGERTRVTDSGSPAEPVATPSWAAPSSAVPGALGAGTAPVDAAPRPRTSWTPPPKRGLLPLRPFGFGAILGAPFRLQRRSPRTTLGPALVVSLVTTALASFTGWVLVVGPQAALDDAYYQDYAIASNVLGVAGAISWWVPLALAFPATALLAGPVVVAASRSLLAERVSFRGARWRLTGRVGALVAWSALLLLAAAGILALASALPLLVATTSMMGGFLAFLVALGEVVLVVLTGGYAAARLGFAAHAIALEGLGIGGAVRRSWMLTRRSGFRLLGSTLLVWAIVGLGTWVFSQPVGWALDLGGGLIFPNGADAAQAELYAAVRTVVLAAVAAIAGAFGLVVQTVTAALLYLDQRMRVEGLDLALARYVDDRQRGASAPDPFPGGGTR